MPVLIVVSYINLLETFPLLFSLASPESAAAFWVTSASYYCACWEHGNTGWYEQLIKFSVLKMFTDGTNNLLFWSWGSIDQRQTTTHL